MKKIEEMSEQEILALTDEDITMMAKQALMEENVKLVNIPAKPTLQPIPKGDVLFYSIVMPSNFVFTDLNEAIAVADVLRKCQSIHDKSRDWSLNGRYFKVTPVFDNQDYLNTYEVEADWGYSKELYSSISSIIESNERVSSKFNKDFEAYNDFKLCMNGKKEEIYETYFKVKNKYGNLKVKCDIFKNSYLPTAENDKEKAMKFMTLAYGLTEEDQAYVLEHYNDTDNPEDPK